MSTVKTLLATKSIEVNINGKEYDCLLIPKEMFVEIDYSNAPYEHPKVKALVKKIQQGEKV